MSDLAEAIASIIFIFFIGLGVVIGALGMFADELVKIIRAIKQRNLK